MSNVKGSTAVVALRFTQARFFPDGRLLGWPPEQSLEASAVGARRCGKEKGKDAGQRREM